MYLAPSEVEWLPFWQYELLIDDLEELNQKEKEEQESAEKNSNYKLPNGMKMPSAKDIQSGKFASGAVPKMQMPKMPKIPKT